MGKGTRLFFETLAIADLRHRRPLCPCLYTLQRFTDPFRWSTFDELNFNWYTPGGSQSDGITWANHISNTFKVSNVTGFLYWWGAAEKNDNEMLVLINGTNIVQPTARLWAHAHFGKRFVRQGAKRIDATSTSASLNVTAFANTDRTVAVQVINNSNNTESLTLKLPWGYRSVQTYLTNQHYDLKEGWARVGWRKKSTTVKIPGQSLLSLYLCK